MTRENLEKGELKGKPVLCALMKRPIFGALEHLLSAKCTIIYQYLQRFGHHVVQSGSPGIEFLRAIEQATRLENITGKVYRMHNSVKTKHSVRLLKKSKK